MYCENGFWQHFNTLTPIIVFGELNYRFHGIYLNVESSHISFQCIMKRLLCMETSYETHIQTSSSCWSSYYN